MFSFLAQEVLTKSCVGSVIDIWPCEALIRRTVLPYPVRIIRGVLLVVAQLTLLKITRYAGDVAETDW